MRIAEYNEITEDMNWCTAVAKMDHIAQIEEATAAANRQIAQIEEATAVVNRVSQLVL